jgi:hypothetical protein
MPTLIAPEKDNQICEWQGWRCPRCRLRDRYISQLRIARQIGPVNGVVIYRFYSRYIASEPGTHRNPQCVSVHVERYRRAEFA